MWSGVSLLLPRCVHTLRKDGSSFHFSSTAATGFNMSLSMAAAMVLAHLARRRAAPWRELARGAAASSAGTQCQPPRHCTRHADRGTLRWTPHTLRRLCTLLRNTKVLFAVPDTRESCTWRGGGKANFGLPPLPLRVTSGLPVGPARCPVPRHGVSVCLKMAPRRTSSACACQARQALHCFRTLPPAPQGDWGDSLGDASGLERRGHPSVWR